MIAKRATAILGAIALILLAIGVRRILNDDSGSDGATKGHGLGGRPVVACDSELFAMCAALEAANVIDTPDQPLDLDKAANPSDGIDGWITWDPAPLIVNTDAPGTWGPPERLASGPLAVLATGDAAQALRDGCPRVDWACVADATNSLDLAAGIGVPTTADGLARVLPMASAFAIEGDASTPNGPKFKQYVEGPTNGQDSTEVMANGLVTKTGSVDLVIGPAGTLKRTAESQQGRSRSVRVITPSGDATIAIVISWRAGAHTIDVQREMERPTIAGQLDTWGLTDPTGKLATKTQAGALWQLRKVAK